jgi:hypothetical protein
MIVLRRLEPDMREIPPFRSRPDFWAWLDLPRAQIHVQARPSALLILKVDYGDYDMDVNRNSF